VAPWAPAAPEFPARHFHHALLLEVTDPARPEALIEAAAGAIRPGGQIGVVQTVATPGDDAGIVAALVDAGCDVRVIEDESARHARLAMQGWKHLVRTLRNARPSPAEAAALVAEAAWWLYRLRAIRDGRTRVMRWGAIVGGSAG
jgi:hypothetical protein